MNTESHWSSVRRSEVEVNYEVERVKSKNGLNDKWIYFEASSYELLYVCQKILLCPVIVLVVSVSCQVSPSKG